MIVALRKICTVCLALMPFIASRLRATTNEPLQLRVWCFVLRQSVNTFKKFPMKQFSYVEFVVPPVVTVKSTVFYVVTLWSSEKGPIFRRNISPSPSGSKNKQSKKPAGHLLLLLSCLAYSSTLKMRALYSFETSALSERTMQRFTIMYNKCNSWNMY
jgi:hypothetical protein